MTDTAKSNHIMLLIERNMGPICVNAGQIVAIYAIENGNVSVLHMSTGFRFEVRKNLEDMRDEWFAALKEKNNELLDQRDTSSAELGGRAKAKGGTLPVLR